MLEWLFYNSVIPLLPVPLVVLGIWLKGLDLRILPILRDGQLCFYCTALSAVALRDILGANTQGISIELSIGGIIFCIILSVYAYGIAVTSENPDDKSSKRLAITSIMTAVTTTVIIANIRSTLNLL